MSSRAWHWTLALAISAGFTVGCATGGDVTPRGGDGGRGLDAGESGVCDPLCADGETCVEGTCVPSNDWDSDGLDETIDCDDLDPAVGAVGERVCAGACGDGVVTCTDGVWGECSAPTSCDCDPGTAPRTIDCGSCGTQRQVCTDGTWVDDGVCTGAGPCSPGEIGTGGACGNCGMERRTCGADCTWGAWACEGEGVCATGATEEEMEACGSCGTGSRARTRTCDATCSWGAYGAWGACAGGGSSVCTPGETDTQTEACGNCGSGTRTRTRTCDAATCDWGAFGAWSACSGATGCSPGSTRACPNGDACGQQVCSSSCTWPSACTPTVPGGCLRIRPGTSGPAGNNYRCCPLSGGDQGWQFCLSTCQWSTSCEPTTSC